VKICLFDWNAGGHHDFYVRSFAEALAAHAEVVVAGSDPLLAGLDAATVELHSLGEPRPRPDPDGGLDKATLAKREVELLRDAIEATEPDQAVVLFADPVLRWLAGADRFPCRISIFLMFATAHFPRAYGLPLTVRERASAEFKEWNIRRWRRRPDAGVLFGLDAAAVEGWRRRRGAAAHWLPEPALEVVPAMRPATEKSGCFLFGYFDERKGMDRLAAALSRDSEGLELTLFGDVAPEYGERLRAELDELERAGVVLKTDFRRVPYAEAMEEMSRSRCALLSFGWRPSGSRVLLEAAAARTPVVVGSDSAVGSLIERHGLGRTADPADPGALREAILSIALDPEAPERYAENLRRYAEELHGDRFGSEARAALGVE
jgi:hypothetical protein